MLPFEWFIELEDWVKRSTINGSIDFSDGSLFSVTSFEISRSDDNLFTN
jgi:hypothetical protein